MFLHSGPDPTISDPTPRIPGFALEALSLQSKRKELREIEEERFWVPGSWFGFSVMFFHLLKNMLIFSPGGFKGNLSLLEICLLFSRGLQLMEVLQRVPTPNSTNLKDALLTGHFCLS